MSMPNFLIIGAAKSGTTALYEYLKAHPQIYTSPIKEPKFFGLEGEKLNFQGPDDEKANNTIITNIKAYQSLFQGVSNETAIGEASPWYLYLHKAPIQIYKYMPQVKLIAILRNPADRAYSNFLHQCQYCAEPLTDFAQALREEDTRMHSNWRPFWHYKQLGFYYVQLKRYFELFDRSQIRVYLYEELCDHPIDLLQDIFCFLGVDDRFIPDISKKYNVTFIPKNHPLRTVYSQPNFISFIQSLFSNTISDHCNNFKKSSIKPLSLKVRKQLIEEYRQDILQLQELIQQDLSHWLTCEIH
ncbi:sulfotransferase family protein [Gloeocapsopsis dulcis]|uniref:Sulfotransferase n=1 Tax=Gloeocapsopsis dulcis AAB1 = 1H9 TaxID=1433147 RepID=A0A6N8G1X6_9CHRO|nr:sulfotransferase [Gloeocapsopsis dulcis]MUL38964.1 sulfotransferase [Gloeocapsopsis dulcis AAB1 = 1H9]WNN89543.1 sulfotransferase [Gloeocapsopsis dulcis]